MLESGACGGCGEEGCEDCVRLQEVRAAFERRWLAILEVAIATGLNLFEANAVVGAVEARTRRGGYS